MHHRINETRQSGTHILPLFLCLTLAIALFAIVSVVPAQQATAADGNSNLHAGNVTYVLSKSKKAPKAYNFDKYIGLNKKIYVLAVAKKTVYVRKSKSTEAKSLGRFKRENCVVVDTSGMKKGHRYAWLKVKLRGSARGYVLASTVKLTTLNTKNFGLNPSTAENKKRIKACKKALPYLGVPYRGGGSSLKTGIVCNKLVWQCLRAGGLKLSNKSMSLSKIANVGKYTSRKKLRPGDVVVYRKIKNTRRAAHVALYIGNGLIINSSGYQGSTYPTGGIRISKLDYRTPKPFKFRNAFSK